MHSFSLFLKSNSLLLPGRFTMHSGKRRSALQPPDKLGSGHRVVVWLSLRGLSTKPFPKIEARSDGVEARSAAPSALLCPFLHSIEFSAFLFFQLHFSPLESVHCAAVGGRGASEEFRGQASRGSARSWIRGRGSGTDTENATNCSCNCDQVEEENGPNLPCGTCNSKGWLLCDFCKGQKTNVQVRANKFYRRCPSCRAVGVVICPQCKVFKCVTFPDGVDGY